MSTEDEIKEIKLRLTKIENTLFGDGNSVPKTSSSKSLTLPELARAKKLENGQQKIAVIVGYHEKIAKTDAITVEIIKAGWKDGKFSGSYNSALLIRAIKDALVRDNKNGTYDLSQTGEDFFNDILTGV